MDGFLAVAALLPPALRAAALSLVPEERAVCEELRLRQGRFGTALLRGKEYALSAPLVTEQDLRSVLEAATRASLHAAGAQLTRGFVSAPGGVRVGVCGTGVIGAGGLEGLRSFSSLSLRVPRAVPGCAGEIWEALNQDGFQSTLIASPPGGGKTTLLRELIRCLSEQGCRVAVADERGEIGAAQSGQPQFDIGPCVDILTGVPKAQAVGMLVRAMNPQVVAMDEITDSTDASALLEGVGCGVRLLATVHGERDGHVTAACRGLLEAGAFRRMVWIEEQDGVRRYSVKPCA
ncbi:MAG: stage III sporulation protein AB [Oscillospiraceae bacterium]|nr:stage III sporulation protein AB [Oscillospiraceae bacterium]